MTKGQRVLEIVRKNLRNLFRSKAGFFTIVIIPILYYSLMGFIMGGIENQVLREYRVGYVNLEDDQSNSPENAIHLICTQIDALDAIEMVEYTSEDIGMDDLAGEQIDALLVFPQGFETYIARAGPEPSEPLRVFFKDNTETITRGIINSAILGTIQGIVNYDPDAIEIRSEESTVSGNVNNEITRATPGYLLYGIIGCFAGMVVLVTTEKKDGLLRRLEATNMTPSDMIYGYFGSNFVIMVLQLVIGFGVLSVFGFQPFYYDITALLVGLFITLLLTSFFLTALGFLAAAALKTPDAAGGGVWGIMIPLLTFSGAFFPLELLAPNLIPFVGWIPTRLIVVLFQDFLVNGTPLLTASVVWNILWLAVECIVLLVLSISQYQRYVRK